jgi:hypothetical protein
MNTPEILRHQHGQFPANYLGDRIAEDLLRGPIRKQNDACAVDGKDGVGRGLRDYPVALLALAQACFHAPPVLSLKQQGDDQRELQGQDREPGQDQSAVLIP